MPIPTGTSQDPIDKIVRRLDEFPELLQALRDGDLLTVRFFWEQLFDCDSRRNPTPTPQAAMKRL